ncbi:DUF5682 family protein [Glycomyces buryatensis]|uniref:ChaN family lipoprotein n=1 Tax=Glycomyces buryatensis TaxID=2570927 RepID=A0A4S8Q711_9ACTN|nr:DUF5682 family protein [Glycomyces buryatensis]THV38502.1 hypothetical protein FAB82_18845 [Glycomyces buryatensis]
MAPLHVVGVRHHSPACARLVSETIAALRPAHVLIEGPADFNGRLDELALDHTLPIAIYSYLGEKEGSHRSWSPLCDYSPEWIALTEGRASGAAVKFIDLPAWHGAFAQIENRYSDAERRYTEATDRLCREFAVDNPDALWDHLVEVAESDGLAERLDHYFALVRGEAETTENDTEREDYMAQWIRAALAEDDGPVLVICGGFHAPALRRLAAAAGSAAWPEIPAAPEGADIGSFLVPYSFKRLDAFAGYQSGMPSPEYYQRLWDDGAERAAAALVELVAARLRRRKQVVSTADLIGAKSLTEGLARLRGHGRPGRTDVLDGLASALINDDLPQPLPWTRRGTLTRGTHPVVVEMTAALAGERTGRLHPDTPAPPLVASVQDILEQLDLDGENRLTLHLSDARDLERSRALHCLRLLDIPGFKRDSGPTAGSDVIAEEQWELRVDTNRLPAVIEAGVYGANLGDAAQTVLEQRVSDAGGDLNAQAGLLFSAALCGRARLTDRLAREIAFAIGECDDLAAVGRTLAVALALFRHDDLFGSAGSDLYATVIETCAEHALWLAESLRAGPGPAEPGRINALAALRDTLRFTPTLVPPREGIAATASRVAADPAAPPDLRGAAAGLAWTLGRPVAAIEAGPDRLGDWLAGLFVVAREEVLAEEGEASVVNAVDGVVGEMTATEFLEALPALRQAFGFFPPRERALLAEQLTALRETGTEGRDLVRRTEVDPVMVASAMELEARVDAVMEREHLGDKR